MRRFLLDLLFVRDGRTLTELESELEMTRFGVMKHLRGGRNWILSDLKTLLETGAAMGACRPRR